MLQSDPIVRLTIGGIQADLVSHQISPYMLVVDLGPHVILHGTDVIGSRDPRKSWIHLDPAYKLSFNFIC